VGSAWERALLLILWVGLFFGCVRAAQFRLEQLRPYARACLAYEVRQAQQLREAEALLANRAASTSTWTGLNAEDDILAAYPQAYPTNAQRISTNQSVLLYHDRVNGLSFRLTVQDPPAPLTATTPIQSLLGTSVPNRTLRAGGIFHPELTTGPVVGWKVWREDPQPPGPATTALEGFESDAAVVMLLAVAAWVLLLLLIPMGAHSKQRRRVGTWAMLMAVVAVVAFIFWRARGVNQFLEENVAGLYVSAFALLFTGALWLLPQLPHISWHLRRRPDPLKAHQYYICRLCGYELTGNISGACPECGCMTEEGRHRAHAAVMARATAPLTLAARGQFHLK
jgi:hypothetical protein